MPWLLDPEVAAQWGDDIDIDMSASPPVVRKLHWRFDGWLGDYLLEADPCFAVTAELAEALTAAGAAGISFDDLLVTKSDVFVQLYGECELPEFRWLKIHGVAFQDDFWIHNRRLAVSDRALPWLRQFPLDNCDVEELAAPSD